MHAEKYELIRTHSQYTSAFLLTLGAFAPVAAQNLSSFSVSMTWRRMKEDIGVSHSLGNWMKRNLADSLTKHTVDELKIATK